MPKLSEMLPSKYIKQSDVDEPMLVTLKDVELTDVSPNGKGEMKWVIEFREMDKPMVLNSTNLKRIAAAYGDDSDLWPGKQMVLYVDEDVSFGGEVVGGLRLRAPKTAKASAKAKLAVDPDEAAAAQYEATRKVKPLTADDEGDPTIPF